MDRPSDAPLGPPEDLSVTPTTDVAALASSIDANRPEVVAAAPRRAPRRGAARRRAPRRRASRSVMVGLDYWYMPMFPSTSGTPMARWSPSTCRGCRGAVATKSGKRSRRVQAERHALESTKNTVRYELRDAAARVDSARQSFTIIDQDLLAQAKRSLEATQAAYAAGQGDAVALLDALRSYLQVRIERVQALAELASSQADLERAAGTLAVEGGTR